MQTLASEPRLAQAHAEWSRAGASIEPGGLHLKQAGEVVSAAGVAGPDWMLWRSRPEAELLAPLRIARQQALAWAGALIGLLSLAMLAWLWWLLRPLAQLERRAEHLFDGTQDLHAGWPRAGGEIGKLAQVLSHVAAERAQLEADNIQVMRRLGSVMSAAPVGIAFTREQKFELVSAEFCRLFGRAEAAMLGQPARMLYASNADYEAVGPHVIKAFEAGQPYVGEWEMLRADGSPFWAQLRGRPVDSTDIRAGTIWTISDIGDQVAARSQLEWSATHDVLTGLANRKALDARLERVFDAMPRSMPAAVVMIDLDHFKPINDTAGHAAGDAMLKLVAAALTACVRASDLVVRQGGDEFVLLLERCSTEVALRIADGAREAITGIQLPWAGRLLSVGASAGVAPLGAEVHDAAAWVAAADAACYRAKAEGRNVVRLSGPPRGAGEGTAAIS
jgi:diguanylate cyclase